MDTREPDGTWAHRYEREVQVGARPPQGPFALYLADHTGYRFLALDLDQGRTSPEQVQRDLRFLSRALDEAGLVFLVAASGPSGGRHLWVPVNDPSGRGLSPKLVRDIARSARASCPSLDISALLNPSHGCLRPPGSPHRHGGYSRLLAPTFPDVAEAYCSAANHRAKFETLARALGPPPAQPDPGRGGGRLDTTHWRLLGRRRPMPEAVAELLETEPTDASAHLARVLTGLALARWSLKEVIDLVDRTPRAPGLEHLRTQGAQGRARRRRAVAERDALLRRQWIRILRFASKIPRRSRAGEDSPRVRGLLDMVARVHAATRDGAWWRSHSGPSDRKALLYVATMALEALTETVEVDCRRLADATGMTPSTASRALRRLVLDGRLRLARAGEGTRAHAYEVVPVGGWRVTRVRRPIKGGTQAVPPPAGSTREGLLERLWRRLRHAAHDVWASRRRRGGLGRHLEQTAAALVESDGAVGVADVVAYTGSTRRGALAHLRELVGRGIVSGNESFRLTGRDQDALARSLGTHGTRKARLRRYQAERRAWAAWCVELAFLRAPASLTRLEGTRYPRTPEGLPDHAGARRSAERALAA